jgi:hypothetical protein
MNKNTVLINDVEYVPKSSAYNSASETNGMEYCVVRSYGAGVFCGYVKDKISESNGVNVTLINSRRIHYWSGACSLSQVAIDGSTDIENCRIAIVVPEMFVANVIEIIPMTEKAMQIIQGAKEWKK